MRYLEFKERFKEFITFSLTDIRKIEPDFDLRRLSEWIQKKYIKNIKREYYIFTDLQLNEDVLFSIANTIYQPSYVSLEMALSFYNLIPESVYGITSVTSLKTNNFQTDLGHFTYKHIKQELMFGYELREYKNHHYRIAEVEKALLDYFYLNPRLRDANDFEGLRFNESEFMEKTDMNKFEKYLELFDNKALSKRVKQFISYIDHA